MKVLLTHTPQSRAQYYGARSLSGLQAIAQVKLHESNDALDAAGLIEAADDVDIIVADRLTAGPGEIFPALPNLRAFVRCAVDIRNIDVDAASAAGVLVTRAGPGFVQSVAELALGFMVDLSRGVSRATADYHSERKPEIIMGRQLAGSRLGIIGYGSIGRYLAEIAKVLGMEILIADPFATVSEQGLQHVPLDDLLARSDFVVCLAVANEQTENLIGQAALARMQRHAFFINLSRGNLVDEAALSAALARKPHRRRRDGCRPRAGPDAVAGTGETAERHRDAAYRRPDAAGDREPVAGNGAAGRSHYCRRRSGRCGQRRALDAKSCNRAVTISVILFRHRSLPITDART